jgi:pantoate--beta-alanine ligase
MVIVTGIAEVRALVRRARQEGKTVGLVPTMGFLHEGHLTLMRTARAAHGLVIASIFVNPLQFGPSEDYAVYPRDLDRDAGLAASAGVDVIFAPAVEEMYPQGPANVLTTVEVRDITEWLCGAQRPGHFRGVATVVAKLFNIVKPDVAYFGEKDAQQVVVVKRMAADLSMDVAIATVPIVREADGLALSSRNVFLNPAERQAALVLSRALKLARERLEGGERNAAAIRKVMGELIGGEPLAASDYISVCDPVTLRELEEIEGPALVALAVRIGKTRLIDNMTWEG